MRLMNLNGCWKDGSRWQKVSFGLVGHAADEGNWIIVTTVQGKEYLANPNLESGTPGRTNREAFEAWKEQA